MHVSLITCIVHHQATVLEFDAEYSEVKLWYLSIRPLHTQRTQDTQDSTVDSTSRISKSITSTDKPPLSVPRQRQLHSEIHLQTPYMHCTTVLCPRWRERFFLPNLETKLNLRRARAYIRKACSFWRRLAVARATLPLRNSTDGALWSCLCLMILPRVTVLDVSDLTGSWQRRNHMY